MTEVRVKIFFVSQRNLFPRFIIAFRPEEPKRKKGFLSFRNLTRQLINSREKKTAFVASEEKEKTTKIRSLFFFFQKCFSLPKGNVSFEKCFVISRKKKTLIEKKEAKNCAFRGIF